MSENSVTRKLANMLETLTNDTNAQFSSDFARTMEKQLPHSFKMLKTKISKDRMDPKKTTPSANYRPWSLDDFLHRLESYGFSIWDIPDDLMKINAPQCSRYGWIATPPKNFLKCVTCSKLLSIKLGDDSEIYETLAEKYHELLIQSHSDTCPWKEQPCSEDLYTIPLKNYARDVSTRYRNLRDKKLASADVEGPEIRSKLDRLARPLSLVAEDGSYNVSALLLAVQGWSYLEGSIGVCQLCFSKVDISQPVPLDFHKAYCPYLKNEQWREIMGSSYTTTTTTTTTEDQSLDAHDEFKQRISRLKRIYFRKKKF